MKLQNGGASRGLVVFFKMAALAVPQILVIKENYSDGHIIPKQIIIKQLFLIIQIYNILGIRLDPKNCGKGRPQYYVYYMLLKSK